MRDNIKNLFFDFIIENWTEEEKEMIKAYVKKEAFEPDDIYSCFGFYYWADKSCQSCGLKRLCRGAIMSIYVPYILDFIKEDMNDDEKQELVLTIYDIFKSFFRLVNESSEQISRVNKIEDDLGLKDYGFRVNQKLGRAVYYLCKLRNIRSAAEQTALDFQIVDKEKLYEYIKGQALFLLRKRGFKVMVQGDDIEIKLPE